MSPVQKRGNASTAKGPLAQPGDGAPGRDSGWGGARAAGEGGWGAPPSQGGREGGTWAESLTGALLGESNEGARIVTVHAFVHVIDVSLSLKGHGIHGRSHVCRLRARLRERWRERLPRILVGPGRPGTTGRTGFPQVGLHLKGDGPCRACARALRAASQPPGRGGHGPAGALGIRPQGRLPLPLTCPEPPPQRGRSPASAESLVHRASRTLWLKPVATSPVNWARAGCWQLTGRARPERTGLRPACGGRRPVNGPEAIAGTTSPVT